MRRTSCRNGSIRGGNPFPRHKPWVDSEDLGSGGQKWISLGMTLPVWVMREVGDEREADELAPHSHRLGLLGGLGVFTVGQCRAPL